ncbi:MAG: FecR family protein [Salaquimonas sp.]|nr:FecR family protein [Salaquimonas sp.]
MRTVRPVSRMFLAAAFILAGIQTIQTARAAEPVGDAKRVVNTVTGAGAVGKRNLAVPDAVYRNESISAATNSHGELQLTDGSRVIVGENSTVSLDNFVVSGSSFSSGTIKVTKGAFRFISGGSGREAIKIKTPLSTIGVRGTVVDVYYEPRTQVSRAVLISGAITACSKRHPGRCKTIRRSCDVIRIDRNGDVTQEPFLHSARRTAEQERQLFDLTANQQRFGSQWRAFEGGCYARAAEEVRNGLPQYPGNHQGPEVTPTAPPAAAPQPQPEPEPEGCGEKGDKEGHFGQKDHQFGFGREGRFGGSHGKHGGFGEFGHNPGGFAQGDFGKPGGHN